MKGGGSYLYHDDQGAQVQVASPNNAKEPHYHGKARRRAHYNLS